MTQKKLQLIGSLTSPYTRIVRVLCEELQLPVELLRTEPFGKNAPEQTQLIKSNNPLGKVPCLITDQGGLIDSRVIANYLLREQASNPKPGFSAKMPLSVKEENFCSVAYGCIDAGTTRFMLSKSDPSLDIKRGYFPRYEEIIQTGMRWLEKALDQDGLPETFSYPYIPLVCAVEWFDKRAVYDSHHLKHIRALLERFQGRPSVQVTKIPEAI